MRIVPRYDLFFMAFYSLLILLVWTMILFISGEPAVGLGIAPALALYLLVVLRKPWRRRRAASKPFPGKWHEFLSAHSAYFRGLGEDGRKQFERDVRLFFAEVRIAGIGGQALAWQTRLLIASGAAAMLHGQPDWEPPLPDGVTVYPGWSFDRNYQVAKGNIAGQAPPRGQLLVAEASLQKGFADPADGFNVLVHELAHFFDREVRKSGAKFRRHSANSVSWAEILDREWRDHDHGASILPAYAAQNEAEFFAVASEVFFEKPWPLQAAHPSLFDILREFYGQDPRQVLNAPRN